MDILKIILYYIILLACIFFVFLCLISEKYEFAIAILGLSIPYATIFMNQDFELKKIKIATVCKNNMETYTQLSQIINKLLTYLRCLEHNKYAYDSYKYSHEHSSEQTKKDSEYYETSINLHKSTLQLMDEFNKYLSLLYSLYDESGICFSSCVDKQYRLAIDKKWITQITSRWHNCNLSGNKEEALNCFFADYNFNDVLCLKKELQKFLKTIKKDLGV